MSNPLTLHGNREPSWKYTWTFSPSIWTLSQQLWHREPQNEKMWNQWTFSFFHHNLCIWLNPNLKTPKTFNQVKTKHYYHDLARFHQKAFTSTKSLSHNNFTLIIAKHNTIPITLVVRTTCNIHTMVDANQKQSYQPPYPNVGLFKLAH